MEPTISPDVTSAKEPERKRPKTSNQPERLEVPVRKDLRENKKPTLEKRKSERPKPTQTETALIKPSEVNYSAILKNLKSYVNPEDFGVTIGRIRKTRLKDLLVEVRYAAKDRVRLDSAFRDEVGETGSVRHLVPTVDVEILDMDLTAEAEEVAEAVRSCLREEPSSEEKVSMHGKNNIAEKTIQNLSSAKYLS